MAVAGRCHRGDSDLTTTGTVGLVGQEGSSAANVVLRFVGIAAAGAIAMAVAAGCGDDSSGSASDNVPLDGSASAAPSSGETAPGEVPYEFPSVDTAAPIPEDSPSRDVDIEVESVPDVAEPGTTLRFAVAITNNSDSVIDPAQLCPSYFMSFGESGEAVIPGLSRLPSEFRSRCWRRWLYLLAP